jgi:hypothetical protein
VQRMRAALDDALHQELPTGLPQRARLLVQGMMAAYRVDPQLHHVLCQEVPKIGELQKVYSFEQHLADVCRRYLFSVGERLRLNDIDRAVFLLVNAVPGVIRAAIQTDVTGQSDSRLADELTDMIARYLTADAA